jgi:hypothetical protein
LLSRFQNNTGWGALLLFVRFPRARGGAERRGESGPSFGPPRPRSPLSLWSRARVRLGGAMPTDLLGPPGRCSGCWPHDGEVAGGAVAISF